MDDKVVLNRVPRDQLAGTLRGHQMRAIFLAKLWARSSSMPASANMRSAAASFARLPLAKP